MTSEVGCVYATDNYGIFKKLQGNREVVNARKKQLIESISERGWIRCPIVVNEKMEVIDGQGRLEALQELGLPVEYVIAQGATIDDCVSLNVKQSNWRHIDYIKCFADMGRGDYGLLLGLYGKYEHLSETCVNTLAGNSNADGAAGSKEIKDGNFTIRDKENLYDLMRFADKCMAVVGTGNGRVRHWCAAFKFVYYTKNIPNDVFLEKLIKNRTFIAPVATMRQTLECLEKIYNYGSKKSRVYFIPEWDNYNRNKKGDF
jgi:hypothetical protein